MIKRLLLLTVALALPLGMLPGCGSSTSTKATATTASTGSTTTTVAAPSSTGVAGPGSTVGGPGSTVGATATTRVASSPTTRIVPARTTVHLTDADNRTTIAVARGTTIVVVLNSTSWNFTNPDAAVLPAQGDPVIVRAPIGSCGPPGQACGTESVTYIAVGAGRAEIRATRTQCGEARVCIGSEGVYSVQVNVSAG